MNNTQTVGLAGLGFLGRGIAACLLAHGYRVVAWTTGRDTHEQARDYIAMALREMEAHQVVSQEIATTWETRYLRASEFDAFAECSFVIESVTEDLGIKQSVFDRIEAAVGPAVPIASNTSALPISLLQRTRKNPERFLGMHWAEPAYATRFLELIRGEQTGDEAMHQAISLAEAVDKDPAVVQRDVPGFIANRLGYAMYREAIHLLESGVADVETIDRAFRNACGLWATFCGPFRWMDITGGPALYAKVMQTILPDLASSPELSQTMQQKLAAGELGVQDGQGFYKYDSSAEALWAGKLHAHAWTVWDLQKRYEKEKE